MQIIKIFSLLRRMDLLIPESQELSIFLIQWTSSLLSLKSPAVNLSWIEINNSPNSHPAFDEEEIYELEKQSILWEEEPK